MPIRPSPAPTKRQLYWLRHVVAGAKSGQRLSRYASTHGLDLQQLYNWKALLKRRGLLPGASSTPARQPRRSTPGRRDLAQERKAPVRFTAVRLAGSEGPSATLRVRFPNGIILETTGAGSATPDRDLLSHLAGLP